MKLRIRSEVLSSACAWKIKECADCTLIVGHDFAWQWLMYTTMGMALFGLTFLERRWGLSAGIFVAASSIALVATLALGRGFRQTGGFLPRANVFVRRPAMLIRGMGAA